MRITCKMYNPRPKRRLLYVRTPGRDLSLGMLGEGRQNLGLWLAPRALSREEGSLSCHAFYDKIPRFSRFHPKVHQFSCLSRQARGTEDLTYPDPNRIKRTEKNWLRLVALMASVLGWICIVTTPTVTQDFDFFLFSTSSEKNCHF